MLNSGNSETLVSRSSGSVFKSRDEIGPETSRVSGFSFFSNFCSRLTISVLRLLISPTTLLNSSYSSYSSSEIDDLVNHHPLFTATDPSKERLLFFYNPVSSMLQVGPTCGLVCLAQAKRFIQPDSEPWHEDTLLAEAKRMGLSNNGEMFAGLTSSTPLRYLSTTTNHELRL